MLGLVSFPKKSCTNEVSMEKEMRWEERAWDALAGVVDGREERSRVAAPTDGRIERTEAMPIRDDT